jgi:hypothetical protein
MHQVRRSLQPGIGSVSMLVFMRSGVGLVVLTQSSEAGLVV